MKKLIAVSLACIALNVYGAPPEGLEFDGKDVYAVPGRTVVKPCEASRYTPKVEEHTPLQWTSTDLQLQEMLDPNISVELYVYEVIETTGNKTTTFICSPQDHFCSRVFRRLFSREK